MSSNLVTNLATNTAIGRHKAGFPIRFNEGVIRAIDHGQINSLADLAKPCRVEPLVIIDKAIANQPYMEDLMKMSLSNLLLIIYKQLTYYLTLVVLKRLRCLIR